MEWDGNLLRSSSNFINTGPDSSLALGSFLFNYNFDGQFPPTGLCTLSSCICQVNHKLDLNPEIPKILVYAEVNHFVHRVVLTLD